MNLLKGFINWILGKHLDQGVILEEPPVTENKKFIELTKNGVRIGLYPTISKMASENGLNKSALYKAHHADRPYKKIYKTKKCQEY